MREGAARDRVWTVLELLRFTTDHFRRAGIESSRLDAELLLAHALGTDRLRLYLEFDKPVGLAERERFRELVRRRARERVPVALLTGVREFWSLRLEVSPDVLVPRPETECLVEAVLERFADLEAELRILDLGTGSGAIALALLSERPKARVTATDLSPRALEVAAANANRLGLADRLRLLEGDLFEPVAGERFDLVISNPPYLREGEPGLAPELAHEPHGALFAGPEGLEVLGRLVARAPEALEPGGWLAFETAPEQALPLQAACRAGGLVEVAGVRDLAGQPRGVVARRAAAEGGTWIGS
ncbi:MAG: peptide chain release factor N(5)-glutamine methyltransferase [Myxococcota bacterium]